MIDLQAFQNIVHVTWRNITKTNKPLTTQYFLLTYYLLTYLLKSNPGNPVPATGLPGSKTGSYVKSYIHTWVPDVGEPYKRPDGLT